MKDNLKQKLEQAADNYIGFCALQKRGGDDFEIWSAFHAGAQTILENPGEWGLEYSTQSFKDLMAVAAQHAMGNELLKSQLTKYIEALERIARNESWASRNLVREAKEALKQQ